MIKSDGIDSNPNSFDKDRLNPGSFDKDKQGINFSEIPTSSIGRRTDLPQEI